MEFVLTNKKLEERLETLRLAERRLERGESVGEFAAALNISASTYYRWQREKDLIFKKQAAFEVADVSECIRLLCVKNDKISFDLLEAIFRFIVWMRWPTEAELHYHGMTACLLSYFYRKFGYESLADLGKTYQKKLLNYVKLRPFSLMCSSGFENHAMFDLWDILGQPYNEEDAAADLGWFLLAYDGYGRKKKPSRSNAYDAFSDRIFKYEWTPSEGVFNIFWKKKLVACPFLFVERRYPSLKWTLDPFAEDFVKNVDAIICGSEERIKFFSRSYEAADLIAERLSVRTKALHYPKRPSNLPAGDLTYEVLPKHDPNRLTLDY